MIEYYQERMETTTGESLRAAQKSLDNYEAVLKRAQRDGAGRSETKVKKTFRTSLKGLPANYPKGMEKYISSVPVSVTFTGKPLPIEGAATGSWHRQRKDLSIIFYGHPPDRIHEYLYALTVLSKILKHELRHFVQDIMFSWQIDLVDKQLLERGQVIEDLSEKDVARLRKTVTQGRPKEYESWHYEGATREEQYFLNPTEFFSWLGQSEQDFLDDVRANRRDRDPEDPSWDPKPTKEEFDQFVGNPKPRKGKGFPHYRSVGDPLDTSPFFAALWKYDRKRWQRAVKELWKRVQNKVVMPKPKWGAVMAKLREETARSRVRQVLAGRVNMVVMNWDEIDAGWYGFERAAISLPGPIEEADPKTVIKLVDRATNEDSFVDEADDEDEGWRLVKAGQASDLAAITPDKFDPKMKSVARPSALRQNKIKGPGYWGVFRSDRNHFALLIAQVIDARAR